MDTQGTITGRYLNLPVRNGASKHWVRLLIGGEVVREFEIELADGKPDFWTFIDVSACIGSSFSLEAEGLPEGLPGFASVRQSDSIEEAQGLYHERYRPQFHFSSRRGWNNDPNGLVYYQGEYHLFYQHNPFGVKWGNMHWGHAISRDLLHWEELDDALAPDELGQMWSGSAMVDWNNTAGFQTGEEKALIAVYTAAGGWTPSSKGQPYTQCIAYSTDRGRSWTKYAGNPVLGHLMGGNRDPKVIWHEPTRQWVMALFLDPPKGQPNYALLGSPDLKRWTRLCEVILPCGECPDFFELSVDCDRANRKWIYWGADGHYLIGSFDGHAFVPETGPLRSYAGNAYAAQTFSDIPESDGRRIQIAWLRGDLPGMPFNQQTTFPVELSLRTTEDGVRLFSYPIREIELLRASTKHWRGVELPSGERVLKEVKGDLLDIAAQFCLGDASQVGLVLRGVPVVYDARTAELSCHGHSVRLPAADRRIHLRVLADRASVEVFANHGRAYLPVAVMPADESPALASLAKGEGALLEELTAHRLRSIWG
jgi:sucrose-6-phosphate hydrolase SacC (GH32 family)